MKEFLQKKRENLMAELDDPKDVLDSDAVTQRIIESSDTTESRGESTLGQTAPNITEQEGSSDKPQVPPLQLDQTGEDEQSRECVDPLDNGDKPTGSTSSDDPVNHHTGEPEEVKAPS